jgi:transcriptional repressor NrdR
MSFPLAIFIVVCQYIDMVCPLCHKSSSVINSRLQRRSNTVWRRRQCQSCQSIWTTTEHIELATVYRIQKDGKLLTFRPEILFLSLYTCLRHRTSPEADALYVSKTVLERLIRRKRSVVTNTELAELCLDILRRYDKTASAVYKAMYVH